MLSSASSAIPVSASVSPSPLSVFLSIHPVLCFLSLSATFTSFSCWLQTFSRKNFSNPFLFQSSVVWPVGEDHLEAQYISALFFQFLSSVCSHSSMRIQHQFFHQEKKMPRSFLVKQPKVHDNSSSNYYHQHQQHWDDSYTVTHAIAESATNLAVRLSENGEFMSL